MPLLNCIVLLASHFVGMGRPRVAGPMAGASTVCTVQPNRANANASEHAVKSWRPSWASRPGLRRGRMLPFTVTHSSYLSPISDRVGGAPRPLIWSHFVTEGVYVTQLTAGKTCGL